MGRMRIIASYLVLTATATLGVVSMLLFGLFLTGRSFTAVDLGYEPLGILGWDMLLCVAFFLQHSVMIRAGFRRKLTAIVPRRFLGIFYTAASGVALLALVLLWQNTGNAAWSLQGISRWTARGFFGLSLAGLLWGYLALRSVDLFGMRPILAPVDTADPPRAPFTVRGPYRFVRHPLYFFVLILIWSCPDVTTDRLLLNVLFTVWMVVGTILEERDLVLEFNDSYPDYQRQVPMLIPWKPHRPFRSESVET